MKVIKFSASPWPLTQDDFNYYTPGNTGIINGFKFEVNNDCDECDYWVVRGNIQSRLETVRCAPENVIFLQDEVYEERQYKQDFLNQFAAVIGPVTGIRHRRYIYNNEMVPWFFKQKRYDDLLMPVDPAQKTRELCLMTSDATWIKGHRTRFAFSNKLIGHFKDRLDVYGRGFNPFECKYDVLKHYKYCIALENTIYPGYFTEKLNECFLSEAFPLYYGCPDLASYYSEESFERIDADFFTKSVAIIEETISSGRYEKSLPAIREMKKRYFENYHLPAKLTEILAKEFNGEAKKKKNRIFSESFYYPFKQGLYHISMGAKILATRTITKINSLV